MKCPAKYCASSEGEVAYLLWHGIYPTKFAENSLIPTLLYFSHKPYHKVMLKYWKGMSIPICEFSECLVVAQRMFDHKRIDNDWFMDMWEEIYDIRSDYRCDIIQYKLNEGTQ
jgi:hypothetical protein